MGLYLGGMLPVAPASSPLGLAPGVILRLDVDSVWAPLFARHPVTSLFLIPGLDALRGWACLSLASPSLGGGGLILKLSRILPGADIPHPIPSTCLLLVEKFILPGLSQVPKSKSKQRSEKMQKGKQTNSTK